MSTYTNWEPIGTNKTAFKGGLDGAEYKISNLKITGTADYIGLFGYCDGATLKNIQLKNANISSSTYKYIGGLVGYATGTTSQSILRYKEKSRSERPTDFMPNIIQGKEG